MSRIGQFQRTIMRENRVPVVLLWSVTVVVAMGTAGCDGATEPSSGVRIEAITPISIAGTVGADVDPAPAVRATDEHGSAVAGVAIEFQVGQGSGAVANGAVRTAGDGSAIVGKWTLGSATGAQILTASAAGLAPVRFTATAVAGPVARVTLVSGDNQIADVGQSLTQPLVARVADAFGNPVAGVPVTFTVTAGGGSIDGEPIVTDSEGMAASGPWTLGMEAGTQQGRAASGTAQVSFSAFAVAAPSLQGRIAFVSIADRDIAIVNADGTGFERLRHPGLDLQPAWSPDGSRIAFVNDGGDGGGQIYVMNPDGTDVSRLTDGHIDLDPAWSPDGSAMAFASLRDGSAQIAALRLADGALAVLADYPGYEGQPSWSPDGRQLAFVSDFVAYDFVFDIYTMNAEGTGQTRRTSGFDLGPGGIKYYLHPAWSPDGGMIAFVLGESIGQGAMRFTVALMSAGGVFLKRLASAGDIAWNEVLDPGSLSWSPDGQSIAYSHVDGSGVRSVKYVSLDGSRQGTIVSDAHSPSWRR
jgi:hypothetical protein